MKIMSKVLSVFAIISTLCGCSGGQGAKGGYLTVDPLGQDELGEDFDLNYLPDTKNILKQSGKIDVVLDFDGNQHGWAKVAEEYERLHGGAVKVNINTNFSGTTYGERLNSELTNSKTDWDICEGNLGYGSTSRSCLNVSAFGDDTNLYCGKNVVWSSVLQETAFKNVESDNQDVYLINSETMQSCWFVNKTALEAAGNQGYRNSKGEIGNPFTWEDLISLCGYMQQAGYNHPLGISLSTASIKSLQFTWLLRIYGDYYYRQFYKYTTPVEYWNNYDPEATNPEKASGFGKRYCKILASLFDDDTALGCGYVGFESEVYKDFVTNLSRMKGYLISNPDSTEFNTVRDQFRLQTMGKDSAQIVLDYLGNGLIYSNSESVNADYFDYPQMMSSQWQTGEFEGEDIVSQDTITRDIGGNGGFLSIVKHIGDKNAQNNLNKDFIKFFLSPYGQTLYYKGLSEANVAPKGLTTVKNELVVIPDAWKSFFNSCNEKVAFNGNVDGNPYISFGIRYFNGYDNTEACICSNWRNLLMTNIGGSSISVSTFCTLWKDACWQDFTKQCSDAGWGDPQKFIENIDGSI